MANFRIFETATFLEDLAEVPASQHRRIQSKLTDYVYPCLRRSPRNHPQARHLRVFHPETWRWRVGDWRAFYLIDDEERVVSMIAFSLRRDAY